MRLLPMRAPSRAISSGSTASGCSRWGRKAFARRHCHRCPTRSTAVPRKETDKPPLSRIRRVFVCRAQTAYLKEFAGDAVSSTTTRTTSSSPTIYSPLKCHPLRRGSQSSRAPGHGWPQARQSLRRASRVFHLVSTLSGRANDGLGSQCHERTLCTPGSRAFFHYLFLSSVFAERPPEVAPSLEHLQDACVDNNVLDVIAEGRIFPT